MGINLRKTDRSKCPRLLVSDKAMRTVDPPISELVARALQNPRLISFAAGLVDEPSLPVSEARLMASRLFADDRHARSALQYGTTLGLPTLRELLVRHVEGLEGRSASAMGFSADDVLLTTGSQQSLYLIGDALLNPRDIIIAASPSYFVYTGALASMGARVIGVPMDEQGMCVEQIPAILNRLKRRGELSRVKFIYCTSFYQNPTGLTLSLKRRRKLLEIVRTYSRKQRILILEDAAYRELRYDGPKLPSIKSFDRENQYTILTQTFSKPFAPGLKLGYTIMPRDLLQHVLRQKGNHDFGSANVCQWLAYEAMRSPLYRRHVHRLTETYRHKRDVMLRSIRQCIKTPGITWTHPNGGLYVWLTLPAAISASPGGGLFEESLEQGVLYVPGSYAFGRDGESAAPHNHLRLCFGQVATNRIEKGIARLAAAIARVAGQREGR